MHFCAHNRKTRPSALWLCALLALLVLQTPSIRASDDHPGGEITVGFGINKPPFVFESRNQGLELSIFREVLSRAGFTLIPDYFENALLLKALEIERVDAIATARDPSARYCQVDEFIYFNNVVISRERDQKNIESVEDLAGEQIAAWSMAHQDLGHAFAARFNPDDRGQFPAGYQEVENQLQQVELFWAGRVDFLIIDTTIFAWARQQLGETYDTSQPVRYHDIFNGRTYFPALFRDEALCATFRKHLQAIKDDGTYQRLYKEAADL